MLKLRIHPDAEQDLFVDAAWYDDRDPGLGDSFLKEVRSDGRRTALNGPTFPALFDLRQRDFTIVNTGAKQQRLAQLHALVVLDLELLTQSENALLASP